MYFPRLLVLTLLICATQSIEADWQEDAKARIDQHRRADLSVRVIDAQGNPIEDALVNVSMQRHAFYFGTAVNPSYLSGTDSNASRYRQELVANFNGACLENHHKWYRWDNTEEALEIRAEENINAPSFTVAANDISSRSLGSAKIKWRTPPAAMTGDSVFTPDLTDIIQPLINQASWQSESNAVVIVIGTGADFARLYSFDSSEAAPTLVLTTSSGTIEVPIASRRDDAEQDDGVMNLVSHELHLGNKLTGLRFANLPIDQGTKLTGARVRFEMNEMRGRAIGNAATRWLRDNGFSIRGHAMIWQTSNAMPTHINDAIAAQNLPYLRDVSLEHIDAIGHFYKDIISEWDVINEQWRQNQITDLLDSTVEPYEAPLQVDWLNAAAHAIGTNVRNYINDFGIIVDSFEEHREWYQMQIEYLLSKGAPLHGVGFQAHYFYETSTPEPEQLFDYFETFATYGLELKITEFDMFGGGWTEARKAEFLEELYTVAFSHPAMTGIQMWGFWDDVHWQGQAPLFDSAWNLKDSGQVYRRLLFEDWWTDNTQLPEDQHRTNAAGTYEIRGFKGGYSVEVTKNDVSYSSTLWLDENTDELVVVLDGSEYSSWRFLKFNSATSPEGAPLADPDNDGLDNESEFQLGLTPTIHDSEQAIRLVSSPTLGIRAVHNQPMQSSENLVIEESGTLGLWTPLSADISQPNWDGTSRMEYSHDDTSTQFIRIRINDQP